MSLEEDKTNSFRDYKCTNWSFQLYSHQVLFQNTFDKFVNNVITFHIFFLLLSRSESDSSVLLMPFVKSTSPILQQRPNSPLSRLSCLPPPPPPFFRKKALHLLGAFILFLQSRSIFLNLWQLTPPQTHEANECGFYFSKLGFFLPCKSHLKEYKVWCRTPLEEEIRSLLQPSLPHLGDDKINKIVSGERD